MKFIIKPFAEIIIKSKPVRRRYLNFLQVNLNLGLKNLDFKCYAKFYWDRGEVIVNEDISDYEYNNLIKIISRTPGVEVFLEVLEYNFSNFEDILKEAKKIYLSSIEKKSFCVRVKRFGTHSFSSVDLEKYIGGGLNKSAKGSFVKLKNPDITVSIEIKENKFYLVKNKHYGIGGYPIGTQDKAISLISGGFDSTVSSFSMMKRGVKLDYLFFNLGGKSHELAVKQVSNYLWKNFSSGYKARFITVNFEEVIPHLIKNTNHKYRGIILKRLFLFVADTLAKKSNYYSIVKGDSLGQVSSQTLKNMFVIDKASSTMVLRPLIGFNKQEIIDCSKKIGTYQYASNMPEYCGVISDKPSTGAKLENILKEEENIDFSIIDKAIKNKEILKIDQIIKGDDICHVETVYIPGDGQVIIDLREEQDFNNYPLNLEGIKIINIPFFDINYDFPKLDQSIEYLFYCDKGIVSKTHLEFLLGKGYKNIKLFKPILDESVCRIKTGK